MMLRLATSADVPRLLVIFDRAFADDPHTQLQIAWRGPDAMRDGMGSALASWLADSHARLLVVEDGQSGQIRGWACWAAFEAERIPPERDPLVASKESSPIEVLARLTRSDIRSCQREVMAQHGPVEVLVAIAVDPAYQSQGTGSALIAWGTRRADERRRVCWVHASEAGSRACARHGFVVHRELVVDLAAFAPPERNRAWGTVRFRSMVRMPAPDHHAAARD